MQLRAKAIASKWVWSVAVALLNTRTTEAVSHSRIMVAMVRFRSGPDGMPMLEVMQNARPLRQLRLDR